MCREDEGFLGARPDHFGARPLAPDAAAHVGHDALRGMVRCPPRHLRGGLRPQPPDVQGRRDRCVRKRTEPRRSPAPPLLAVGPGAEAGRPALTADDDVFEGGVALPSRTASSHGVGRARATNVEDNVEDNGEDNPNPFPTHPSPREPPTGRLMPTLSHECRRVRRPDVALLVTSPRFAVVFASPSSSPQRTSGRSSGAS